MIRGRNLGIGLLMLGAAAAGTLFASLAAAQTGPSMSEIIRDTQKHSETPNRLTMAWWLPEEFWSVSFRQNASLGKDEQESFLKTVRPYLIVAVVDGKIGAMGGSEFVGEEALRASVRVVDAKGRTFPPLSEDKLSGDVKVLVAAIQSMFENMLGAMGQGMHLFFFTAQAPDGTSLAEAAKEGGFTVKVGNESFKWRLPLECLIPAKICPEDGERMSGAWKYCPWHGKPLVPADEPKHEEAKQ
jgi:hypothetical protein